MSKGEAPKEEKESAGQRISSILQRLGKIPDGRLSEETYQELCLQIFDLSPQARPPVLYAELSRASGKALQLVRETLRVKQRDDLLPFEELLPAEGWLARYMEWTTLTEAPAAFHFFVGAVMVGSTLGRHLFFDKGAYPVYPNLSILLIAPAGRCRKTSAANLGMRLLVQSGGRTIADKITPEALIDSLKVNASALIYAPELAVFLGKQKYQEGMVPLLTALLDCPKEWTTKTIGRGEVTLMNVFISSLLCSTTDWLQSAIPSEAFGGGFMSRFIFVVQEDTNRFFPLPPAMSEELRSELVKGLTSLRSLKAQAELTVQAREWYVEWYRQHMRTRPPEGHFSGYYERKQDHILRLGMILRASESPHPVEGKLLLPLDVVQRAERMLSWLEAWLPRTFDRAAGSIVGDDQGKLLRQLKQSSGCMEHSVLLRKNSWKMNAEQFRRAIGTLMEAGLVEWKKEDRKYYLTPEGWL